MAQTRIDTYTLAHKADLYITDCPTCGVVFGMPNTMRERRYDDGKSFWCPNGHSMSWRETAADRERKARETAERRLTWERQRRDQAEAEAKHQAAVARGHKGAHQRTKNRVAKGVCPCCNRSFTNLAKHMAGQHPDFGSTNR